MVKQTIQIFARIKPTKAKTGPYELDSLDDGNGVLSFFVPKELADGLVNNKKENYKFKFAKIFDQKAEQEDVFNLVAKPVIDNVISGYNGTIFAYGQTGSGKTFTITGGAEKYSQRGIIPRTLSYIFQQYDKMPGREFSAHVSYLELYNEAGYDLLDPKHDASKLEDLPKVTLMEDESQNVHLKNLSVHPAGSEEDALNLLFLGDTNRMIAETPMNQASTRSHCIFTIHLMSKEVGSATVRRSKLHLVDLAGSERVAKTGANGVLLTEAKYINLSLHYLEQVIVALAEKSRSHIPYRNSMMTSVLRDSLGGNCMTTMIATCSVERKNIDESISTCRFAQRVAMIKNDAQLNEEMDPRLLVERLKQEIALLKEELAIATGGQPTDPLSEQDIFRCQEAVDRYLEDDNPDALLNVGTDMRKLQRCYLIMKGRILSQPAGGGQVPPLSETTEQSHYNSMEMKKLQDLLLQRDNEINILVNMLKKEKKKSCGEIPLASYEVPTPQTHSNHSQSRNTESTERQSGRRSSQHSARHRSNNAALSNIHGTSPASSEGTSDSRSYVDAHPQKSARRHTHNKVTTSQILGDMSAGRQQAFEMFKQEYSERHLIDKNKTELKTRYAEAKRLGTQVNSARNVINQTKHQLEQHRVQRSMSGKQDPDEREEQLKENMEQAKLSYKESFAALKALKTEIEHLQHYLERSKVQLMKDFELWWAEQSTEPPNHNQPPQHSANHTTADIKSAWRTPPPSGDSGGRMVKPVSDTHARHNRVPPLHGVSSETLIKQESSPPYQHQHQRRSLSNPPLEPSTHSRRTDQPKVDSRGIQLTGDAEADADIMAFLKARQSAMNKAQSRPVK